MPSLGNAVRNLAMGVLILAAAGATTSLVLAGAGEEDPAPGRLAGPISTPAEIEQPDSEPRATEPQAVATDPKRAKARKSRHATVTLGPPGRRRSGGETNARVAIRSSASGHSPPSRGNANSENRPPKRRKKKPETASANYSQEHEPLPDSSQAIIRLYHLYNPDSGNHFYTTSSGERYAKLQEGYKQKAIVGRIFPDELTGTIALNTDDGHMGYIFQDQEDGSVPVYYLRGPGQGAEGDVFTSDDATRQKWEGRSWIYLGIVGYIPAPL